MAVFIGFTCKLSILEVVSSGHIFLILDFYFLDHHDIIHNYYYVQDSRFCEVGQKSDIFALFSLN